MSGRQSFSFLDKENQVTCSPVNYFSSFQCPEQLLNPPVQLVLPDLGRNWDGLQQMTRMQESKPGLPAKNKQRFHSFGNISGTVRSSGFLSASVKRRLFIHAYLGDFHLLYCSLSTKRKLKSHRNNERCKVSWMPGEKHAFPNNPHTPRGSLDLWEMSSSSLATGSSSFTGGGTQHSSAFHPGIFFLPLSKQTSSMYQSTSQRSY